MEVAQITYRLYKDEDLPGILLLWENYSGWGAITSEQFTQWYVNTPLGACLIVVATDETDTVLGQIVLVPAQVVLNGQRLKAVRLSAPILHPDLRQADLRSSSHPAMMMVMKGIQLASEKGYHILYSLPAHAWIGVLNLLQRAGLRNLQMAAYECNSISLTEDATWSDCVSNNLVASRVQNFNRSYDELFADAINDFPISVCIARSAERLQWKISHHIVVEVRNEHGLLGYAAYKKNGLLVDLLARTNDDLKKVFTASLKALHFKNDHRIDTSFEEVKCMMTSSIQKLLEGINHQPANFQFAFGSYPLQKTIDKHAIAPGQWYMMPDD